MINQLRDIEVEGSVLGGILLENWFYEGISDVFHLELFTNPDYKNVAKCIIRLKNEGKEVDILSVTNQLKKSDYLTSTFTAYSVTQLTNRVVSGGLVHQHVLILQEMFMKREVVRVSMESIQKANAFNSDAFDVVDGAEAGISAITSMVVSAKIDTSEQLYKESLKRNQQILDLKGKLIGISSGFRKIDEVTGGWQESKLIVLAGATSMGKTALALDFALNAALSNYPVGIFSLEMPSTEMYARLQSKVSNIELSKITKWGISGSELESFKLACSSLQRAPIFFDETSGISIFQLKNRARKMYRQHKIKILIIDYLQLMEGEKKGNREQEVASISRGLKSLSKELKIPIIALSQLSRDIDKRPDKEPKLSDLRESGAIEQDADMVCFVYRPEYYGLHEEGGVNLTGKAKFIIKKHRGGALDEIILDFEGKLTKFYSEGIKDGLKPIAPPLQENKEFLNDIIT